MILPLWFRKWLGTWWGDYCSICGDKLYFDGGAYEAGYGTRTWCVNKKCPGYKKRSINKL